PGLLKMPLASDWITVSGPSPVPGKHRLSQPDDAPALTGRVLIADDLPDAARSLAMLFELYGAEVRFTLDGAETLRVAESFRPEIVLLDISMPGMSGY